MLDGAIAEREHCPGAEARGFADRFQAWRQMTRETARGWALLLAEGMPGSAPGLHAALAREIEAYARQLLWSRLRSRGLSPAQLSGVEPIEARRLGSNSIWPSAAPEPADATDGSPTGEAESAQGPVSRPDASRPYTRPMVTREVFDRFCRWTGMDPGCLGGPEENQAGLVFYLVVFAMLTCPGGAPDLPSLKLFKKLRQCREQLTRQAEDFLGGARSGFPRTTPQPSPARRQVNDRTLDTARENPLADRKIR